MNEYTELGASVGTTVLGHLALHYRTGDGHLVVKLFQSLGLRVEDLGPARNGDRFLKIIIEGSEDRYFFAATACRAQIKFEDAMMVACGGSEGPLEVYRGARRADPEANFHIGIRYESLEFLERVIQAVQALALDPQVQDRIHITLLKPPSDGSKDVDLRMAASPVFAAIERESFGEGIIQVFIQTDIIAGGLLSLGQTIELDYVFPAHETYVPAKVYE